MPWLLYNMRFLGTSICALNGIFCEDTREWTYALNKRSEWWYELGVKGEMFIWPCVVLQSGTDNEWLPDHLYEEQCTWDTARRWPHLLPRRLAGPRGDPTPADFHAAEDPTTSPSQPALLAFQLKCNLQVYTHTGQINAYLLYKLDSTSKRKTENGKWFTRIGSTYPMWL